MQTEDATSFPMPPTAPEEIVRSGRLVDAHDRTLSDLRLSVTDRCNYRCTYCMGPDFRPMPGRQLLELDEYLRVARICAALGIDKIRITGGEPTLYPRLDELIRELGRLHIKDLAMTTNGSLLTEASLTRWRNWGLRRITLSLDSLRPKRMAAITGSTDTPQRIISAVSAAQRLGYEPVKVNCVIRRGMNHDEIADFADLAREHGIEVRLIEIMPLDSQRLWSADDVVSSDEMLGAVSMRHELVRLDPEDPRSTARIYRFADDSPGRLGIIAAVTHAFCGSCQRLRLTADGRLRPCLFSDLEWDLKPLLRGGCDDDRLRRFIIDAAWNKPAGHEIDSPSFTPPHRLMPAIGG